MKKQNNSSEPLTKVFLESKLDSLRVELLTDVREEINEAKSEIDQNAKAYRDQILAKMDEVLGELQDMREENIIGTHHIRELRKADANHERRIKKLEQMQQAP